MDAIDAHLERKQRLKEMELKAQGRVIRLLDALATMLAPTLLKDGEKIAKKGSMLQHLEDNMKGVPVIAVDPAKVPDPSQMKFV